MAITGSPLTPASNDSPDPGLHTGVAMRIGRLHIYSINGAIQDVDPDETAFNYRDADFVHVILAMSDDAQTMPGSIDWAKAYWDALHPLSAGGAYVNFMMDEGTDRVQATYRDSYPRLQQVKRAYDPDNLFRVNQNIRPN